MSPEEVPRRVGGPGRPQGQWISANLDDAVSRVAAWLVRFAADHGPRVDLPGGQQGLAEELGLTRVTANRALMQLARDKLIQVDRGRVVLLAPELLAHRASRGGTEGGFPASMTSDR